MNKKAFLLIMLISSAYSVTAGESKEETKKGGRTSEQVVVLGAAHAAVALLPSPATAPACFGRFSPASLIGSSFAERAGSPDIHFNNSLITNSYLRYLASKDGQ